MPVAQAGAFSFGESAGRCLYARSAVLRRAVVMLLVMNDDCGYRKPYMLLLGRKNPHSSLTDA